MTESFEYDGWDVRFVDDAERLGRGETSESVRKTFLLSCVKYIKAFDVHVRAHFKVSRDLFDNDRATADSMLSDFLEEQTKRAIEERLRGEERL